MVKLAGSVFTVDVDGLDAAPGQPAYTRLYERIRIAIASGTLKPYARLPSSRVLAKDLCVARNTVEWALGQLVADGYVIRRRGAGSFVAGSLPERDAPPLRPKRSAASTSARTQRHPSRFAQALQAYPGHPQPVAAVPFTPSLPPIDLFPRQVWNRILQR